MKVVSGTRRDTIFFCHKVKLLHEVRNCSSIRSLYTTHFKFYFSANVRIFFTDEFKLQIIITALLKIMKRNNYKIQLEC